MKLLADSTLPNLTDLFADHFTLTTYDSQEQLPDLIAKHDILLCRSTLKVSARFLANSSLQCVATASSGVDHIDTAYLTIQGIHLFDAKGCNARSVADYVIATLALLQKNQQLTGNKAGVIGAGEVGRQVIARLCAAGMDVVCFDPLKAIEDSSQTYCSLAELASCDLLCIHANLHDTLPYPSENLFDATLLAQLKPGVVIVNAARGGIVNEAALLANPKPIIYCTDVYCNEPAIDPRIVDFAHLCTPHIAGHSVDAKIAAVIKICEQLHHHYKLPMPPLNLPLIDNKQIIPPPLNWQDCVLDLYNPLVETFSLKTASDKKQAFITLRPMHQNRHDFINYDARHVNSQIKSLLGYSA